LVAVTLQASLDDLGLDYVDLYLIHWPQAYVEEREMFPKDDNGKFIYSDVHFLEAWKAMEDLVDAGKIKSIGLSNFNSEQIQEVIDNSRIKPVNHQIELNPYLSQDKMFEFCKKKNITVTAYSPLGSADRPWAKPEDPTLLEDSKVTVIADRLKKTPAQVVLHWGVQRGVAVIPKSVNEGRIKSNFELFDFSLTDDDMAALNSFAGDHYRACGLEWVKDHPLYPFNIPF